MSELPPSKLLSYLRLFRLPNVFTAIADVMMGFLFVRASLHPWGAAAGLMLASSFIYTAGMILNDVFDYEVDLRDRPFRPLPSGQIDRSFAKWLGLAMLAGGIAAAAAVSSLIDQATALRATAVAAMLSVCVLLYDGVLKKTRLAPLAMGSCRFFNVLLGMSVIPTSELAEDRWRIAAYDASHLVVAGGIGLYIVGVTWFARNEARDSNRFGLMGGTLVMAAGIALLAVFPYYGKFSEGAPLFLNKVVWPGVLLLLSLSLWRRCVFAIVQPTPARVQAAVKHGILSLIVLDAAVCLAVCGPYWAIAVIALLLPTLLIGKWVYST